MFSGFLEFPNMSFFAALGGIFFSLGLKDFTDHNHDASMYASCIGDHACTKRYASGAYHLGDIFIHVSHLHTVYIMCAVYIYTVMVEYIQNLFIFSTTYYHNISES